MNIYSKDDKPIIYSKDDKPIITIEEQKEIVDWITINYIKLYKSGYNRYMKQLDKLENVPKCIWDIKQRIIDKELLHNNIQEPVFKDAIGYMLEGGQLQEHTDPNPANSNLIHTRFNVYVQLPEKGGRPIYNNTHCNLNERSYICCRSGIDKHLTDKVEGNRPRIILSFGFLLPYSRIKNIEYLY